MSDRNSRRDDRRNYHDLDQDRSRRSHDSRGRLDYDDRSRAYEGSQRDNYRRNDDNYRSNRPAAAIVTPPVSPKAKALPPIESTIELELLPAEPVDPEVVLAERRRKRAEILAKYSNAGNENGERENKRLKLDQPETLDSNTPLSPNNINSFSLFKDDLPTNQPDLAPEGEVSAADYDPDMDRKLDDERQKRRVGVEVKVAQPIAKVEPITLADDEDDDDDDMFAIGTKRTKFDAIEMDSDTKTFIPIIDRSLDSTTSTLVDNFDDADGYYKLILGELLDGGRYHVHANLGKGMFSTVVRARDTNWKESNGVEGQSEVAIKVIRSQESMYKAAQKEVLILRKLQDNDPLDKKHLVRLLRTFEHRGHLCLVFENLSMNLREVVKRFGKDVGINLKAVRAYASQMFLGLALLKKCEIMHADIKPDNILVNESKATLKICDLGSASDTSENDITPYLVSRFYRAPEIILGLPYDCSLDVWSIGCTLYELYTGKILFPGRTNNHMLLLIMELKGKFSHKVIKKSRFGDRHFDESMSFLSIEKNDSVKSMSIPSKAVNDFTKRLMSSTILKKMKEEEIKSLSNFVDLLEKMLTLDPSKRPTPKELLNHSFLRG